MFGAQSIGVTTFSAQEVSFPRVNLRILGALIVFV
jgi:hypothetical protein